MSSNLNDLNPYVKHLANKFLDECNKQNLPVKIYFTFRTIAEQDELYAQGRTKSGKVVTNAKGGQSYHNYGLAFDAAPLVNGDIDWNNETLFNKMGQIGQSVGLEWGGSWKSFKDTPHFQWSRGISIIDLQRGRRPTYPTGFDNNQSDSSKPQDIKQLLSIGIKDVKVFQEIVSITPDGILGPKTDSAISIISKKTLCKKGSTGINVRYIQYKVGGKLTGIFDDATLNLVKAWQSNKKLTSDGIVGDLTWKSFFDS
ncbi:MAG: M15 family metallopeptidase [Romboutsia sp.]|uniref:M15 family metallopeptidase n=1 Tax=Romboutsia sp. TaxID=1965302 RepID=UPI003F2B4ABA